MSILILIFVLIKGMKTLKFDPIWMNSGQQPLSTVTCLFTVDELNMICFCEVEFVGGHPFDVA